jgi:hypothetical protein
VVCTWLGSASQVTGAQWMGEANPREVPSVAAPPQTPPNEMEGRIHANGHKLFLLHCLKRYVSTSVFNFGHNLKGRAELFCCLRREQESMFNLRRVCICPMGQWEGNGPDVSSCLLDKEMSAQFPHVLFVAHAYMINKECVK